MKLKTVIVAAAALLAVGLTSTQADARGFHRHRVVHRHIHRRVVVRHHVFHHARHHRLHIRHR